LNVLQQDDFSLALMKHYLLPTIFRNL